MFFLYTKHDRRRDAGGQENALRGQKRRGVCAISSHTQWRNSERAGGFNVWKGSAARSFQTMNVVWSERFCTGKACGYRFMDTCRGGASASQCHQMAVSLTGRYTVARYRAGPAGAKGGALRKLRPATEPQLTVGIGIRQSAQTHFGDFAAVANRAGWGIRRGKREEGSMEREMCLS